MRLKANRFFQNFFTALSSFPLVFIFFPSPVRISIRTHTCRIVSPHWRSGSLPIVAPVLQCGQNTIANCFILAKENIIPFSIFEGWNETTLLGVITASLPVLGFLPVLSFSSRILNDPNPLNSTFSPFLKDSGDEKGMRIFPPLIVGKISRQWQLIKRVLPKVFNKFLYQLFNESGPPISIQSSILPIKQYLSATNSLFPSSIRINLSMGAKVRNSFTTSFIDLFGLWVRAKEFKSMDYFSHF